MADEEEAQEETRTEAADPEDESEGTSSGGGKKMIFIAIGAVVLLAIAGAGTFFLIGGAEAEQAEDEETSEAADGEDAGGDVTDDEEELAEDEAPPEFFALDTFVINISDGKKDRYLKLKVELDLTNPDASEEIEKRMAQLKDVLISLLGSKSFDEVRTIEGKNQLREEMMARINAIVRRTAVKRIYFTEFVVQ